MEKYIGLDVDSKKTIACVAQKGKYCFGKTPMRTFLDPMPSVKEKMLNNNIQTAVA